MTTLASHLDRYLALRRALGYKLNDHDRLLSSFVASLKKAGEQRVTVRGALAWASQAGGEPQRARRLTIVRGFATYMSGIDPATEIPPTWLAPLRVRRVTPFLFSKAQIRQLLQAARRLEPESWATTMATLVGLLAATGIRPGEAYRLNRGDVDLSGRRLAVTHSKLDRSRLLPLHPTTVAALRGYLRTRDALARRGEDAFFLSRAGRARIESGQASVAFRETLRSVSITVPPGRRPPRLYDLRHSFAVRTIIDWHKAGVDVQRQLPVLSAYLGHLVPAHTYWYLEASPELLAIVAERLAPCFEGLS